MNITVFGLGYVGMTSAVCLAELGHRVTGVEINHDKLALITTGRSPIVEPGVEERLADQVARGLVRATDSAEEGLRDADAAFICVGTPAGGQGAIDDSRLLGVIDEVGLLRARTGRAIPIFVRSTALPQTHRQAMQRLAAAVPGEAINYCVHPEFLRAGQAIRDFHDPPKIIFGISDENVAAVANALYPGIAAPVTITDPMTAALIKYADNIFHAVKVTYTNEISQLAKANDVDARKVMELVVQDTKLNISPYYMRPGFAFGGSCLPKDLRAALAWGRQNLLNLPMLEHVMASNQSQVDNLLDRVFALGCRNIGLFGLAFKAGTDDLRESPLVTMTEVLLGKGKHVRVYDPALEVDRIVGQNRSFALSALPHLRELLESKAESVVGDSDLVIIARDFGGLAWRNLPWRKDQLVLDLDGRIDLGGIAARREGLYWS